MDINLGGLLGTVVIGGLAGWAASIITKTDASMGIIANILVGIFGAVLGNILMPLIGFEVADGFTLWSFVVALIGATILLFSIRIIKRIF